MPYSSRLAGHRHALWREPIRGEPVWWRDPLIAIEWFIFTRVLIHQFCIHNATSSFQNENSSVLVITTIWNVNPFIYLNTSVLMTILPLFYQLLIYHILVNGILNFLLKLCSSKSELERIVNFEILFNHKFTIFWKCPVVYFKLPIHVCCRLSSRERWFVKWFALVVQAAQCRVGMLTSYTVPAPPPSRPGWRLMSSGFQITFCSV